MLSTNQINQPTALSPTTSLLAYELVTVVEKLIPSNQPTYNPPSTEPNEYELDMCELLSIVPTNHPILL